MKWTNSNRTNATTTLHAIDGNYAGTNSATSAATTTAMPTTVTSTTTQNGGSGFMSNGNGTSAGDRRSIFYTNEMDSFRNGNNTKFHVASKSNSPPSSSSSPPSMTARKACMRLRSNAAETMEMHHRKCENLISYFTQQTHQLNEQLQNERKWRDTHLAKILKALLSFETKLKTDQKHIRMQLYEKDNELNRLAGEVRAFRLKYNIKDDETATIQSTDAIAQYCPNCRKQYYHLDAKDVGVQVTKQELNCANESAGNNRRHNTSSDDGLGQVFSEARRSKRYMSKRTSGTFQDYLKSRSIELTPDTESTSTNSDGSKLTTHSPVDPVVAKLKSSGSFVRKGSMRRSARTTITVRNTNAAAAATDGDDDKTNGGASSETSSTQATYVTHSKRDDDIITNDKCDTKTTISADDTATQADNKNSFLKKYDCEVTSPKTQFESTDDWYASASDMDDSDSAVSKPYGYNAVNPVLECVNQILLQQSMDGLMDVTLNENAVTNTTNASTNNSVTNNHGIESSGSSSSKENNGNNNNNNTLKKRVQFSTQNSMVQVPRSGTSSSTSLYHMPNAVITSSDCVNGNASNAHATTTYATIYSNDYEPIGSEQHSSNHYVDMESKLSDEHRPVIMEKSKTPPALPPKPANLMKLRQLLKFPANSLLKQQQSLKQLDNESEPDYCSISEVHEAINTKVQIVVDVHKMADDDVSSVSSHGSDDARTDFTDETFADVPKLPNVAAIISPKKEPSNHNAKPSPEIKFTTTKSASSMVSQLPQPVQQQQQQQQPAPSTPSSIATNILSEITMHKKKSIPHKLVNQHNKMSTIEETAPTTTTSTDKVLMPIQAEFDWYNLDVEYGRMTTIGTAHEDEGNGTTNFGVEYNLDAEFSLTANSSPTGENNNNNNSSSTIDMRTTNAMKLHHNKFTNSGAADVNDVNMKSFDSFLEHTGLTAKPLPQKRKIFYNAPFV